MTRPHPALQALVRWDPGGFARREIEERAAAHLPPASRMATVTGDPGRLEAALAAARAAARGRGAGPGARRWRGPARRATSCATSSGCRAARAPRSPRALGGLQAQRSARKLPHVRVEVDPAELG